MTKQAILCFLLQDDEILLAQGNYRPGKITWNGISGFVEGKEKAEEAAVRELYEEIKVRAYEHDLTQVGVIHLFHLNADLTKEETLTMTVFICEKWQGEPRATEQVRPKWFDIAAIPYKDMFEDNETWLPKILAGDKVIVEVISERNEQTQQTEVKDVLVRSLFA